MFVTSARSSSLTCDIASRYAAVHVSEASLVDTLPVFARGAAEGIVAATWTFGGTAATIIIVGAAMTEIVVEEAAVEILFAEASVGGLLSSLPTDRCRSRLRYSVRLPIVKRLNW
jgi:hypothetical protein